MDQVFQYARVFVPFFSLDYSLVFAVICGVFLGEVPFRLLALSTNIRLKRLAKDKHSSVLWRIVNHGYVKLNNIGARSLLKNFDFHPWCCGNFHLNIWSLGIWYLQASQDPTKTTLWICSWPLLTFFPAWQNGRPKQSRLRNEDTEILFWHPWSWYHKTLLA